ncbi:hypothetical protein C8R45DRAFT_365684 [Mycena sanguinolenta]|nr:hypothetical protein C8R45DRAFT_365684 [Mycena sanguinolenta]
MATVLLFVELSADIIFCIFAHCDIASVVSVAQTCRYLHSLAFEKTVWIVLLADLRRRCILDRNCTPDLETLSTAEMIGVARRLLTGPQTWSPGKLDGNSMAESSRKITLHPYTIAGNRDWNIAKLLRSGRYVLFTHSFRLGCWSVADDKLVWMYTTTIEDEKVYGFAAEETEANATIMVCVCANLGSDTQRNYVEMVNLDLETGTHTSLLIARAPDSDEGGLFSGPVICGALAVASMPIDAGRKCAIVLNWKEQSYFVLHGRSVGTFSSGSLILNHQGP